MYFDDEIHMTYTFKKFEQVQIHQMCMIIFFIEIYETLLFSIGAKTETFSEHHESKKKKLPHKNTRICC